MKILAFVLLWIMRIVSTSEDERLPNKCEVCKFLTVELQEALEKTGAPKKCWSWESETRLADALDDICQGILQYNVHAERPGSLRYAKGASQTMTTLKNLVHKGVKVDLGMPFELWDEPSVEVSDMKKQCETMLEEFEEVVEDWYFHHQDQRLENFLCLNHALKSTDQECLSEVWKGDMGTKGRSEMTDDESKTQNTHDASEF